MYWFNFIHLIILAFLSPIRSYRFIELTTSTDDQDNDNMSSSRRVNKDSDGRTERTTFIDRGRKLILLDHRTINDKNKKENGITSGTNRSRIMELILSLNQNASENKPAGADEVKKNYTTFQLQEYSCFKNCQCKKGSVCNTYKKRCEKCRRQNEICRKDENCCADKRCVWGRCRKMLQDGSEGSLCNSEMKCKRGMCCAKKHGVSVCKKYLSEGEKCRLTEGGLEFSLNHECPCEFGLECKVSKKRPVQRTCVK